MCCWPLVAARAGRTAEEQASDLVRLLLTRGVIVRTERKYKRPKPGRTRLVKYPRTLLVVPVRAQWQRRRRCATRGSSVGAAALAAAEADVMALGTLTLSNRGRK